MNKMTIGAALLALLAVTGCGGPSREELRNQAITQYQVGRVDQAKTSLEQLQAQYPGDPEGLYLLGRIYQSERAYPQAMYYYRSCLQAAPWHKEAKQWLASVEQESGTKAEQFQFEPQ